MPKWYHTLVFHLRQRFAAPNVKEREEGKEEEFQFLLIFGSHSSSVLDGRMEVLCVAPAAEETSGIISSLSSTNVI